MKPIIKPVSRTLLMKELKEEYFLRETNRAGNEIYVVTAAECPNVMKEIGRLREWAFRFGSIHQPQKARDHHGHQSKSSRMVGLY